METKLHRMKAITPTMAQVRAALKRQEPSCEIWTITPEIAAFLADENGPNTHNRDVRKKGIKSHAIDMATEQWLLTGDSIKLGTNETLLDGQHRLKACVLARVPFTTVVLAGLDEKYYIAMDTGAGKKAADIFKKYGVKYHAVVASAVQQLRRYTSNAPIADRAVDKPHVLLDLYEKEWPDLSDVAGNVDVRNVKQLHRHPHATLTALRALFGSVDEAIAAEFFREWAQIRPHDTTRATRPLRVMQRALEERDAHLRNIGGRMDDRDRVLMIVRTWRAVAFGEALTMSSLQSVSARAGTPWPGVFKHNAQDAA